MEMEWFRVGGDNPEPNERRASSSCVWKWRFVPRRSMEMEWLRVGGENPKPNARRASSSCVWKWRFVPRRSMEMEWLRVDGSKPGHNKQCASNRNLLPRRSSCDDWHNCLCGGCRFQ